MSWNIDNTGKRLDPAADAKLDEALRNFRQSVHAWSDAAYNRPRGVPRAQTHHHGWRLAVAWALGGVLAAGTLSGSLYQHHQHELAAKRVVAQAAEAAKAQQIAAAQHADEDLLATVDSDVSRTVPAAMEPLAQLMDGEDQEQ